MIAIPGFNISLIFYPFFEWNRRQILDIKAALKSFDNTVYPFEANRDLIPNLQKYSLDLAFNLTRYANTFDYTTSAICELLEIPVIGPKIFTASVCSEKEILLPILQHDGIPLVNRLDTKNFPNYLQIFLLANKELLFFIKPTSKTTIDAVTEAKIKELCKKTFQSIHGSNYCEFGVYLEQETNPLLVRIDPMPNLEKIADFARAAKKFHRLEYNQFINLIVLNAAIQANLPIPDHYQSLKI
jgi:D-alanine-D-alanine ligase-like ATP-grasp enzyme